MKQLQSLLSGLVTVGSSLNPVRIVSGGFLFLRGKWRMYWNYCPECNSFAPKVHHCDVCHNNTKAYFAWNKEVENEWWMKYTNKHGIGFHRLNYRLENSLKNPEASKAVV